MLSIAKPTDYAKKHNRLNFIDYNYYYDHFYCDNEDMCNISKEDFEIKYNGFIGNAAYFLRNLFVAKKETDGTIVSDFKKGLVTYDGEVDEIAGAYPYYGIRPAIWVSIK